MKKVITKQMIDETEGSNVYVYLDKKSVAVKIGKADDIEERLSQLQTGNPNTLELLYYIPCDNKYEAFELEAELHAKYQYLWIRGEWFIYDEKVFNQVLAEKFNTKRKEKRKALSVSTLYGEVEYFGNKNTPRCFFYPNQMAQILHGYEKAFNMKMPYRTMAYPTYGKRMIGTNETDRVFISTKKHNENLELKRFQEEKLKYSESTLEKFLG